MMDEIDLCVCCLRCPPDKDLTTPYTHHDETEIYSDMLQDCFNIQMVLDGCGSCGICSSCAGRLRDASDFKLQVQRCQAELRARTPARSRVKGIKEELDTELPEDHEEGTGYERVLKELLGPGLTDGDGESDDEEATVKLEMITIDEGELYAEPAVRSEAPAAAARDEERPQQELPGPGLADGAGASDDEELPGPGLADGAGASDDEESPDKLERIPADEAELCTCSNTSNETDVDMKTNSQNESERERRRIISNMEISELSSFVNLGEVSDNEVVSIADLNLIEPMRLDQGAEDSPKLLKKKMTPRKKRRHACRNFTSTQITDSETDTQDFSPSDGSDFDPDSTSRFSDDSMMNLDVKNHPDHKKFWKKSLLERQGSKLDKSQNNDQKSEDNLSDTVTKKQKIDYVIDDMYDEAVDDTEESDLEHKEPEQPTKEQKKKRKWLRKNACIFCENLVTNFTRHLLKHHKNESEVLQYMLINDRDPKVEKQRKRQITDDLRNRGNFLHNSKVIFEKEGELIPKKGTFPLSSLSTFTTCKNCLATFKRKYFYKHFKSCGSGLLDMENLPHSYKKRVLANHSISIIPHLSAASQEVKTHILPRLRNDEISLLVKKDPLILAYGTRLMKKKKEARNAEKLSNEPKFNTSSDKCIRL